MADLCGQRRLRDIAELQRRPYPGVKFHINDDLSKGCLILSPENQPSLHLTVTFTDRYPLEPPRVTIQSKVSHPNVQGSYVCASILNTAEGYTSAYTLKGIFIQLLSFFASETMTDVHTGQVINLEKYRQDNASRALGWAHECSKCGFDSSSETSRYTIRAGSSTSPDGQMSKRQAKRRRAKARKEAATEVGSGYEAKGPISALPDELLMTICDFIDYDDLIPASRAWHRFSRIIPKIIRNRELQCYVLKTGFDEANLGIGVQTTGNKIESEFDLLSWDAFNRLGIRYSVQGVIFKNWLPLPLSKGHWLRVRGDVDMCLQNIRCKYVSGSLIDVLYSFMNNVVVQLSESTAEAAPDDRRRTYALWYDGQRSQRTLLHASEKAIESYFHLYHLLLCLAVDRPQIVQEANQQIKAFVAGQTDKAACPNLGHLLIMLLIADAGFRTGADQSGIEELYNAVIKEAITRSVVWMLEGHSGLSYMEPARVSQYRLKTTFEASKTSYRLMMFLNLMRKTIVADGLTSSGAERSDAPGQSNGPSALVGEYRPLSLMQLRNVLFKRRGGAPEGAAAGLAASVRRVQGINDFGGFFREMGMSKIPTDQEMTRYLRDTVYDSMDKGYSKWVLSQEEALYCRRFDEFDVIITNGMKPKRPASQRVSFFPKNKKGQNRFAHPGPVARY